MIFLRKIPKHFPKCSRVLIIRHDRELHSNDHNQHVRIARSHFINDRLQIIANAFDRDAAKRVVDPEFEDEDVDLAVEMCR